MKPNQPYIGIHDDLYGGMTDIGRIIRDAWAFGLIPETETCKGWLLPAIQELSDQTHARWQSHGFRVANLPPEIRERYLRIQNAALARARAAGWQPEDLDD